jgi:hypothetical protein
MLLAMRNARTRILQLVASGRKSAEDPAVH